MSNLIVRIREVSQQLAIARANGADEDTIFDLEDELLDLEDELEDETAAKHSNTRVDY
ncbi:hypothetical protein [Stenotrophomonas phage RAS14]